MNLRYHAERLGANMRSLLLTIVLAVVALPLWSQNDLANIKREYAITAEKLEPHADGFSIDDDNDSAALLERKWQLAGDWVSAWLGAHPRATERQISTAVRSLDKGIEASVVRLRPLQYVIATHEGETGTVFIVAADSAAPRPFTFHVVWTIRDKLSEYDEELAAWTAPRARGGCREGGKTRCGPLFAKLVRLPDTAPGHQRFYLDALYAQPAGMTVGSQFSVWEWDGERPRPLLMKTFAIMLEQSRQTKVTGNIIHVYEKGFFHSFFSCGSCEERQFDWRLHITPTGVEDLGESSLVPEMDALDKLVTKLERGESVANSASNQVVEFLAPIVAETKQEAATRDPNDPYFSLGMLSHTQVTRVGGDIFLCFSTDDVGPLRFRMQRTSDGFFFHYVQDLSEAGEDNACTTPPSGYHQQ